MRLSFVIGGGKVNFRYTASGFKDIYTSDVDIARFGLDFPLLPWGVIFAQYHIDPMLGKPAGAALKDRVMRSSLDPPARGLSCSQYIHCVCALEAVYGSILPLYRTPTAHLRRCYDAS